MVWKASWRALVVWSRVVFWWNAAAMLLMIVPLFVASLFISKLSFLGGYHDVYLVAHLRRVPLANVGGRDLLAVGDWRRDFRPHLYRPRNPCRSALPLRC